MLDTEQLWARKISLQDELEDIEREEKKIFATLKPRVARAMGVSTRSVYSMGIAIDGVIFKVLTREGRNWKGHFITIPHDQVHNENYPPQKEIE